MEKYPSPKQYDLEERTFQFAKKCRLFIKKIHRTIGNIEDSSQLVRSSGSIAANYIEANESISRKDFVHRIKLCRKESKESNLWLQLMDCNSDLEVERKSLSQEANELMKIFSSIMRKSQ